MNGWKFKFQDNLQDNVTLILFGSYTNHDKFGDYTVSLKYNQVTQPLI